MKKKETLNFRVSAEFKRRLIEQAEKERRSLTNYLETILTKLWDEQELITAKKKRNEKRLDAD
jgi:predicted HicB family RNase H-like nuclease